MPQGVREGTLEAGGPPAAGGSLPPRAAGGGRGGPGRRSSMPFRFPGTFQHHFITGKSLSHQQHPCDMERACSRSLQNHQG